MKSYAEQLESALAADSAPRLWDALRPIRTRLTLPHLNRLSARLQGFKTQRTPVKLAMVRTYTTELLKPYWTFESLLNGLAADVYDAPLGALYEEACSGVAAHQPDVTCFMLSWEDLDPRFRSPFSALDPSQREDLLNVSVDRVAGILSAFRRSTAGLAVVTLLPAMVGPELGQYDFMSAGSESAFRARVKHQIAARFRESLASVHFDDLDALCGEVGRSGLFDARLWLSSRFPFSTTGALALVRRLIAYPVLLKHPRIKVIVLDADNTMWGGIVGEDGPHGIALGPGYPGEAFVALQHRLLELQQRGILLAICSKNNPRDVEDVLANHPHQLLRQSNFAAIRVNWEPKVENLRALADELNLGLDSFLFLDDSPHECHQVREQLPQVLVVQTPSSPVEIPFCLEDIPRLQILSLTQEDTRRAAMYAQERERKQLAAGTGDYGQYLRSLKMVMTVSLGCRAHLARVAQLTQKTNQFNLTTRRYLEADIALMMDDPDCLVADFSLADSLGDSGIVGVAILQGMQSIRAKIDTFLMSCRVIGRGAETAFLAAVLDMCKQRGVQRIVAEYLPTAKNALVKDFWLKHDFGPMDEQFELDLARPLPNDGGIIRVRFNTDAANFGPATDSSGEPLT